MMNGTARKALRGFAFAAVVLALACSPEGEEASFSNDPGPRLHEYMSRLENLGFSGAVLVGVMGQVVLEEGYGLADREGARPVTAETVFTTGSITKQFTGAAILKLEMMGLLATDDPISTYLDDVPDDKRGITLHHLLTHTSGLPGAIGDDFDTSAHAEAFVEQAMGVELLNPPGDRYEYSNVGFSLLGIILERVSGMGYEEFLREHLFEPAGMKRTGYLLPDYADGELAVGYRGDRRWGSVVRQPMLPDGPGWHLRANGGIHSTVGDMYRWHQALEGDGILSSEAREKLFHPFSDEGGGQSFYGYGWSIVPDYMGRRLITHNGGNGIFSADFRRFVDDSVVIYASSNLSDWAPVDYVTRDLSRLVFGADVGWPPQVVDVEASHPESLAGVYRLPSGAEVEVAADGAHLLLTGTGAEAGSLLAGGAGESESPLVTRAKERSEDILRRAFQGDFAGIQEAMGGGMPLERVAEEEGRWMEMRTQRYGKFQDLEAMAAIRQGGEIQVYVRMDHVGGAGYIMHAWEGDDLVGVELVMRAPVSETRVYPVSTTAFESFDLQSPTSVRVRFDSGSDDDAPGAMIFQTAGGEVRMERVKGGG